MKLPRVVHGLCDLAEDGHLIHPLVHVILIAFEQILVRVAVAGEQPQSIVLCMLDIAVGDNLSELLRHLVNSVRTAVRLHQRVPDEVLVQVKSVQRLRVEPRQHHINHQQDVHLRQILLLHAARDVLAVCIEGIQPECRAEHRVVVIHTAIQQLLRVLVAALVHVAVGLIREDGGHAIPLVVISRLIQSLERVVVLAQRLDGVHREQCCVHILALRVGVLLVMLKDVLSHQADTLVVVIQRLQIEVVASAIIRVTQLLGINAIRGNMLGENRTLVLDREAQHVSVRNRVFNHVAMQAGI